MADNYLEKKMEEYRASTSSRKAMHRPVYGVKPGTVALPYPMKKIAVIGVSTIVGESVVSLFRKADCRVAFSAVDSKNGTMLAQNTGARFYPCDEMVCDCGHVGVLQRIAHDMGKLDAAVIICDAKRENLLSGVLSEYCHNLIAISSGVELDMNEVMTGGVIANNLIVQDVDSVNEEQATALSRLCLFLTMPGSECISGQRIHIGMMEKRMNQ